MVYTKEQVSAWKKKHGDIFEIEVGGKSCIVRKPTRKDLSYLSVIKDLIKMSETMLRQLWVDGDTAIQEDDEYFLPVIPKLEEVMKIKEAQIKKTLADAEVPGAEDGDVLFLNTMLRYYMHMDPDTLSDEEWAHTIRYLIDIRRMEAKAANGQHS